MAAIKIDKKIAKYRVEKPADKQAADKQAKVEAIRANDGNTAKVIRMTEEVQRPEVLIGSTYKIKTPVSDHAMYVTINDIVLNEGTVHNWKSSSLFKSQKQLTLAYCYDTRQNADFYRYFRTLIVISRIVL